MLKRLEELREAFGENFMQNEPLSRHTSFRTGGEADYFLTPPSALALANAIEAFRAENLPYIILGNMTNVIVRDGGIRGAVIVTQKLDKMQFEDGCLWAEAGVLLSRLAGYARDLSLAGLEFAHGIPGSVGGAVVMNAGAYEGEISHVLGNVSYLDASSLKARMISAQDMAFGYRKSLLQENGGIVLSACFCLKPGDSDEISKKMKDLAQRRRDKQPLSYPSAGSIFRRPEGYYTGDLIQRCGLKGYSIGGAQVSEKHAGFIINTGGATSADIISLIAYVQEEVKSAFGVELQTEVKIIGNE